MGRHLYCRRNSSSAERPPLLPLLPPPPPPLPALLLLPPPPFAADPLSALLLGPPLLLLPLPVGERIAFRSLKASSSSTPSSARHGAQRSLPTNQANRSVVQSAPMRIPLDSSDGRISTTSLSSRKPARANASRSDGASAGNESSRRPDIFAAHLLHTQPIATPIPSDQSGVGANSRERISRNGPHGKGAKGAASV
jgi:hypothetical protein